MIAQVPDEIIDPNDRKIAMDLMAERKKLQNKIEGKDPALSKPIQDKIDNINEQLNTLTQDAIQKQATSEVSLQPETEPSKEMEAGGPEAGPQAAPQQGVLSPEESQRKEELTTAIQNIETGATAVTIGEATMDIADAQAELDAIIQKEQATPEAQKQPTTDIFTAAPTKTRQAITFTSPDGIIVSLDGNEQMAAQLYDEAIATPEEQRSQQQNKIVEKMQPLVTAAAPAVDVTTTEVTPVAETTTTTEAAPVQPAETFTEQDRARKQELTDALAKADKRRKNITVGETVMPKADVKAELDALNQKELSSQQPVTAPVTEVAPVAPVAPIETAPVQTLTPEQEADKLEQMMLAKMAPKVEAAPVTEAAPTTETAPVTEVSPTTEVVPIETVPALKDVESTAKALEDKSKTNEDSVDELEDKANVYITDLIGKIMDNIISNLPYSNEIKDAIRKHFSITKYGEFRSSLGAERTIKTNDVDRTKQFIKNIGIEILKTKFDEGTKEYSNELDKLNKNINEYFQSLLDAEEKGETPKANKEINEIINILYDVQAKYEAEENNIPNNLSEAYHKAKADGSNPQLVEAVEKLFGKEATPKTKGKPLSDAVRGLKIKGPGGLQSNILGVPIAIWNAAMDTVATAIDAGKGLVDQAKVLRDAIAKGYAEIKEKYKAINKERYEAKVLNRMYSGAIEMAREGKISDAGIKIYLMKQGLTESQADALLAIKPKAKEKIAGKPKLDETKLSGYNEMMDKVDAMIARQTKRGTAVDKMAKNLDALLRKFDAYINATDAQKKALEQEARNRIGAAQKRAPSTGRILGAFKDITNLGRKEKSTILNNIMKLAKDAANDLANEIKAMKVNGKITISQFTAIQKRLSKVNFSNESSISSFVDYMANVFNDVEYDNKMQEVRKLQEQAKRKKHTSMNQWVKNFTSINPELIPANKLLDYIKALDDLNTSSPFYGTMNKMYDEVMSYKNPDKAFDIIKTFQDLADKLESIAINKVKSVEEYVNLIRDINAFKKKAYQLLQNGVISQDQYDEVIDNVGKDQAAVEKK
jgi:hypothetical protein